LEYVLWGSAFAGFVHLNYYYEQEAHKYAHTLWDNGAVLLHSGMGFVALIMAFVFPGHLPIIIGVLAIYSLVWMVSNTKNSNPVIGVFGTALQLVIAYTFSALVFFAFIFLIGALSRDD